VRLHPALQPLHASLGHASLATGRDHLDRVGEQAEDALLLKASFERSDGFGVGLSFLGALNGRAVLKKHQRADDLIASLDRIAKVAFETVKIELWLHPSFLPGSALYHVDLGI